MEPARYLGQVGLLPWMFTLMLLCRSTSAQSQTIQDLLKLTGQLSKFNIYLQRFPIYQELGDSSRGSRFRYTLFAPRDEAFDEIPSSLQIDLKTGTSASAMARVEEIMMNHIVVSVAPLRLMDISDQVENSMSANAPKLFFRVIEGNTYVNGAQLLEEIICTNGVIHIIDRYLHQVGIGDTAYKYIQDNVQNTQDRYKSKKFLELMDNLQTVDSEAYFVLNHNIKQYVTLFLPSDLAFRKFTNQEFAALKNNIQELKKVVHSHIITGDGPNDVTSVYYASLLNVTYHMHEKLVAMEGSIQPKVFGGKLFVSNDCAQGMVDIANITVTNGAIHMIDGLLGHVYQDAYKQITTDHDVSDFGNLIGQAGPTPRGRLEVPNQGLQSVPDSRKFTLFVPDNYAVREVTRNVDLNQNLTQIDALLRMHMLPMVMFVSEMHNMTEKDTNYPGSKAMFYQNNAGETWVEVNHVRGRITKSDMCVKNGVLHYVDGVLGMPAKHIYQHINDEDMFVSLYQAMTNTGLEQLLNNPKAMFTIFAPNNVAFQTMQAGDIGRQLLDLRNSQQLGYVLKRHIIRGEFYLDSIPDGTTVEVNTMSNIKLKIKRVGEEFTILYEDKEIKVIDRDNRMINGVFNVVDAVIYVETPQDMQVTGSAATVRVSLLLILSAVLLYLLC